MNSTTAHHHHRAHSSTNLIHCSLWRSLSSLAGGKVRAQISSLWASYTSLASSVETQSAMS